MTDTSPHPEQLPVDLLDRWTSGTSTPEDRAQIAAYVARFPAAKPLFRVLDHSEPMPWRGEADLRSQLVQMARRECEESVVPSHNSDVAPKRGKHFLRKQILRGGTWIGAMTTLLVGMLFFTHRVPRTQSDVTRAYTTAAQQQAIVNLDDGTRVTLAPQTTLRIRHFGTQSRMVLLDSGEAYFEVARASGAPFIVRSGAAVTQVLGTAFLVRHGAGDPHVHVAVMDGKVRVTQQTRFGAPVTLTAGQVSDVTDSTTQVSRADELASGAEWLHGRIIFHHTPVATVLETVSRWYGYQFRYADSALGTRKVTMEVSTRSSAEALADLEEVLEVNLTVIGDTITLVPQPVQSRRGAPRIQTYDVWTPNREVGR